MAKRRLPARTEINVLKGQAKQLLNAYRSGDGEAESDFRIYHPRGVSPQEAQLSDAQLVLARSYRFPSWPRLKTGALLTRAIHDADLAAVEALIHDDPRLLHEPVRGSDTAATWGTPLAYAAYFGRQEVVELLVRLDGGDSRPAFERASAAGLEQYRDWFIDRRGRVNPGAVMHACEVINADGLSFFLERGAEPADAKGDRRAPVAMVLRTYNRYPEAKHRCLEILERFGAHLPDTPAMAFHRGRIDLLDAYLKRDPQLLDRRFSISEIYPPQLGFGDRSSVDGLHGTPLDGGTLLHLSVDFDEMEIARWLLDNGADPNVTAAIDRDGFGGQTALFHTVVSQAHACGRQHDASMARLILSAGADPNRRASLRKALRFHRDEKMHEYRDVTPIGWGRRFHAKEFVSASAIKVVEEYGGTE